MENRSKELDGSFDIGKVVSLDHKAMRGRIKSVTSGTEQDAMFNPSPYMGIMPKTGETVAVFKKHSWFERYLFPIARERDASAKDKLKSEEQPGDVPRLSPGDMFVGPKARLFFDDTGNATLRNFQGNLSIKLNDVTSKISLSATNYSLSTPGNGIRILTESSVPTTFGDSISIQKNAPLPTLPEELTNFVPSTLTELSSMNIDSLGGISLSSIAGLASLRLSAGTLTEPFLPGNIRLENPIAGLKIDATGSIGLETVVGDVSIRNILCNLKLGEDQSLELSNTASSLTFSNAGIVTLASSADMVLNAGTSLTELASTSILLQAPAITISGVTTVAGSLMVSGGAPAVMTGTMALTGAATLSGALTVAGVTTLNGALFVNGMPSFVGVTAPAMPPLPLMGVSAHAKIAVLVNGVVAGFIPVIP